MIVAVSVAVAVTVMGKVAVGDGMPGGGGVPVISGVEAGKVGVLVASSMVRVGVAVNVKEGLGESM